MKLISNALSLFLIIAALAVMAFQGRCQINRSCRLPLHPR
jgi:hypothetical protein